MAEAALTYRATFRDLMPIMTDEKTPLLHRLPMTRLKLLTARLLYRGLKLVLTDDRRRIRRRGVNYEIDLSEGIDLSLFVFGGFQDHVTNTKYFTLPPDAIVFDVGANIGGIALRFAQSVPQGRVYVFEPTAYAYQKLLTNLSLNPELAARITPVQAFVSDVPAEQRSIVAYSSWKIDGTATAAHPLHGGTAQAAESIPVVTIDEFCTKNGLTRLDLIKIDTDGHELQVLHGARRSLEQYCPTIIFEAGLYLIEEKGDRFEQYCDYLSTFGYTLINSANGHRVTRDNYRREIPQRATTDILAIPQPGPGNQ
jgi:FkbM family methyltransferase